MTWGDQPTEREKQCLANALLYGQSEAAARLDISAQTLKNHLTNLYARLGAESYADAAIALGWLDIPGEYVVGRRMPVKPTERHHPASEQLLAYADSILRELENR